MREAHIWDLASRCASIAALGILTAGGCPQQQKDPGPPPPAGSSCQTLQQCPGEQVCTDGRCRYRQTSAAGEVLAVAARDQFEQSDLAGAVRTYDKALEAYEEAKAPLPPKVVCGAATAALKEAGSEPARERAAKRADACLRNSMPGDPHRTEVLEALAKLRYEGLALKAFDAAKPADRFFTKEPQRPTVDAVQIALDLPDSDEPVFEEIAKALRGSEASRKIADCFIKYWEQNHKRQVNGSLVLDFKAELRDMGYYDLYEPQIDVKAGEQNGNKFTTCSAKALSKLLKDTGPKNVGRSVEWKQAFEVAARVQ